MIDNKANCANERYDQKEGEEECNHQFTSDLYLSLHHCADADLHR